VFLDAARILARTERIQRERIAPAITRDLGALTVSAWQVPGDGEPVGDQVAAAADAEGAFRPVTLPQPWGRAWSTWWFRLEGTVPQLLVPAGTSDAPVPGGTVPEIPAPEVRLDVDLGFVDDWPGNQCEGLLLADGMVPLKAINSRNRTVGVGPTRTEDSAAPADVAGVGRIPAAPGDHVRLFLEAAANPDMMAGGTTPTELGDRLTAPPTPRFELRTARWISRDPVVWGLWHDVDVLKGLAEQLPEDSTRRAEILCGLDDAMSAVDLQDVAGTAGRSRQVLAPLLAAPAGASALEITTIGHAHIDSAWLWPVRETVRKVGRTFSNVAALMDEYPEFTFTATSAQQYAWLEQSRPEVFERVREAVARGQWFPSGGMWVESDANLPGGEALIRQFTYGIRYFQRAFGTRSRTLWLPDSFGYSAALPQIARLVGMDGFLTQKISWSKTNQLPHSTMWWQGIDGTRILTHFPPVNCYDSMLTADEVALAEKNFREKGRAKAQVIPFGYGDGGGGPTASMLERARRREDLEGSPHLRMGDPDSFFDHAREEYGDRAPVYRGELYLEFHRGVFTSQLEIKQGNRRAEHALRALEFVWSMVTARALGTIDQQAVDELWQRTLLLQFHDILPGSSIAWVNRDAHSDHAWILARCEELTARGLALLAGERAVAVDQVPGDSTAHRPLGTGRSLLNVAPHPRTEVIEVAGTPRPVTVPGSALVPLQDALAAGDGVPPVQVREPGDGSVVLDNGLLRVVIGAEGTLDALRDLVAGREVLPVGARANRLQIFEDLPNEFDAWDVDRHYRDSARPQRVGRPTRIEVSRADPARASVRIERMLGVSPAVQTVTLDAGGQRIDLGLEVDWHERESLLKASFPLAVQARDHTAEIQFGHVTRPLHENTSWEFARFEVPMHRWVLAEEPGYGAALVTDSTYGYDALPWSGTGGGRASGTELRLSLMRGPNWPDPRADRTRRSLHYSLVVDADATRATQAGQAMNLPLRCVDGQVAAAMVMPTAQDPSVHVEAVLPAHDGSGDLIVRLYEGAGSHTRTRLDLGVPVARVWEVDPLDDDLAEPQLDVTAEAGAISGPDATIRAEGTAGAGTGATTGATADAITHVEVSLHPFQILSLRLSPQPSTTEEDA
jgi:alpha-mannosidase